MEKRCTKKALYVNHKTGFILEGECGGYIIHLTVKILLDDGRDSLS